jgi:hypothetical protein
MSANQFDPVTHERTRNIEMRAAVDVMFEALSHIQASLETTSEEKRVESYRTFKEALYDRFEYLVEQRKDQPSEPESAQTGAVLEADASAEADEDDTLEKLWPAIASDRRSG